MSQKVLKFGSADIIRFIEIYRRHECLWDTDNVNYKHRDARNIALASFAEAFGVEDFGPKEITTKIKNLRTQYLGERKKIKDSMESDSGTAIYKTKLLWYPLMDSFLNKTSDYRETAVMNDTSLESQDIECIDNKESVKHISNTTIQDLEGTSTPTKNKKAQKKTPFIKIALKKLDNIEKRARREIIDDEIDSFGKYVASSLRTLSAVNNVHAQNDIQSILSKYKLRDLKDIQTSTTTET